LYPGAYAVGWDVHRRYGGNGKTAYLEAGKAACAKRQFADDDVP